MKYTEAKKRQAKHLCLFGEPKTGKSTLTAKLALAGYKLLWISMDNGHTVIDKLPVSAQENIDLIVIPDTAEYPIASETVLKLSTGAKIVFCERHGKDSCTVCKANNLAFNTVELNAVPLDTIVVFDHGTQFARSCGFKIGIGDPNKKREKDESWEEFRKLAWMMDKFLTNIQQARYNTVMMAHVIEAVYEDNSKKLFPLMGSRNFSTTVGGFFDHIVYCEVFNQKHSFGSSTKYKASVMAGSRTDTHIEEMTEPSLIPFFNSLEEVHRTQAEAALVPDKLAAAAVELRAEQGTKVELIGIVAAPPKVVTQTTQTAQEMLARMRGGSK